MFNFLKLKNPLVQYIPISINDSREGVWQNPIQIYNDPIFFVFQDPEELSTNLSQLSLPRINSPSQDNAVIVALNFKVEKIYFRFVTVKLIGQKKKDYFHLFNITKKYFNRRTLYFTLYTAEGDEITGKNINIL